MSGGRQNQCVARLAGCTADPAPNRLMCEACRVEHNKRAAERRAALRAAGKCVVCGRRAARVAGESLATCPEHREYFRARGAARRG